MSKTTTGTRQSPKTHAMPIRRVILSDPSQLPSEYSQTPGGTLFSTTPGGTRIIYDRAFLMRCRNSPLAKSPPPNLPQIPGVTSPMATTDTTIKENGHENDTTPTAKENAEEPQFEMDI